SSRRRPTRSSCERSRPRTPSCWTRTARSSERRSGSTTKGRDRPGVTGPDLAARLLQQRFDFFTGVPCSLIESLIEALEQDARVGYLPAVREDVAVGVAAGGWLGRRGPVVLMKKYGFVQSPNGRVLIHCHACLTAL